MSGDFLAKGWLEQLGDVLVPHIMTGLMRMFQESKKINPHQTCKILQLGLRRIPQLSTAVLQEDYRILLRRGCRPEWLHQMIMGIFATYARAHLVSQGASSDIQIRKRDLEIPDNITFLHLGYIEAARALWTTPYLFSDKYDVISRQENLEQARRKVLEALQKTVIRQIPFQRLYQRYLVEQESPTRVPIQAPRAEQTPPIDKNPLEKVLETSQEAFATPDLDLDLSIQLPPRPGVVKKPLEKSSTIPPEWIKSPLEPLHIEKVQTLLDNQSTFSSKLKSQIIDRLMTVPEMPAPEEPNNAPNVTLSSTFNLTLPSDEENSAAHEKGGDEQNKDSDEGGENDEHDVVEEIVKNESAQEVHQNEMVQEEIKKEAEVVQEEVIEMVNEMEKEKIPQFASGEVGTAPCETVETSDQVEGKQSSCGTPDQVDVEHSLTETDGQEERGEVITDKVNELSTETAKQTIVVPLIDDPIDDPRTPSDADSTVDDSMRMPQETVSEEHNVMTTRQRDGESGIINSPVPLELCSAGIRSPRSSAPTEPVPLELCSAETGLRRSIAPSKPVPYEIPLQELANTIAAAAGQQRSPPEIEATTALSDDELFQCFDELPPALIKELLQRLQTKITTTETQPRPYIRIARRTPPGSPRSEERRETARTHLLKQRIRHLLQRRSVQMSV